MAATTLVAARLEPELKNRADKTIRSHNLTATDVIRRVYEYIVITGDIPEFIETDEYDVRIAEKPDKFSEALDWIRNGPLSGYNLSALSDDEMAETLENRRDLDG